MYRERERERDIIMLYHIIWAMPVSMPLSRVSPIFKDTICAYVYVYAYMCMCM